MVSEHQEHHPGALLMMNHLVTSGSKVRPQGRAPRRVTDGKVCAEPDCSTQLSTYNRKDTCFRHSPIRFLRTRGRAKPN
jgi:hypothetical protein